MNKPGPTMIYSKDAYKYMIYTVKIYAIMSSLNSLIATQLYDTKRNAGLTQIFQIGRALALRFMTV